MIDASRAGKVKQPPNFKEGEKMTEEKKIKIEKAADLCDDTIIILIHRINELAKNNKTPNEDFLDTVHSLRIMIDSLNVAKFSVLYGKNLSKREKRIAKEVARDSLEKKITPKEKKGKEKNFNR